MMAEKMKRKVKHERKLLFNENKHQLLTAIPWPGFLILQIFKYFQVLWHNLVR